MLSPVLGAEYELDAMPALKEVIVEVRSENMLNHIIKYYRSCGRRSMLGSMRNEGESGFRWGRGSERLPWEVTILSLSQLWDHSGNIGSVLSSVVNRDIGDTSAGY